MTMDHQNVPVIPITETVIFPGINTRIFVNEEIGMNIKRFVLDQNTLAVGVTTRDYLDYDMLTDHSFYRVGVLLHFDHIQKSNNGYILEINTLRRAEILHIDREEGGLMASYAERPDFPDLEKEDEREMTEYIKHLMSDIGRNFKGADYFLKMMDEVHTVQSLIGYTVPMMSIPLPTKQELLEIDSLKSRALRFIDFVIKEKDSVHLQLEISKKYAKNRDKAYREAMLREQLKNIRIELGEMGAEDDGYEEDDDDDYRRRIEESDMPDRVRKVAMKELRKLEAAPPGSAEVNVIMNYLDLILELPWHCDETDIDIEAARQTLDRHHYGIEDVKKRIVEHLSVMKMKKDKQGSILLLVGPPGTGKTSLGKSVAEALGRQYVRASLGGVRDESEIRGHRRTYIGAMAGRIIKGMVGAGTMNPVFILDEHH